MEWQKTQDRNGISTTTNDVRIKTEPQSHHHHHHHHYQSAVTTTIYQAKAAIACLKQENNNYNPRVNLPGTARISQSYPSDNKCRTGQLLMIATPNNLTSKNNQTSAGNNSNTTSSLYATNLNGVCPSRLVNGKSTSPAKNGLGSVIGSNNQHLVTSSSSSNSLAQVSNGCSPTKRKKDEDEVSQSTARDCSRATNSASPRKKLKITFGKDTGRN